MNSKRRSTIDLINISDDDSASEQPPAKSNKREEVVELQRKVMELDDKLAKSEKNFQGACRIAGEAQERVKFLENLLDTKPNVSDGATNKERENELEKKVNELTNQLDEERMRHRTEKNAHEKKIEELTSKLAQYEALSQTNALDQQKEDEGAEEGEIVETDEATLVPPVMPQNIATAVELPLQYPAEVQPHLLQARGVTIRARFSDISKIGGYKLYSDPTEFAGITWKISVFKSSGRRMMLNFLLYGEKHNENKWPSNMTAEIQFFSHKENCIIPWRKMTCNFNELNEYSQRLVGFRVNSLYSKGYLIDDSILVAVVLRALPSE